MKTPQCLVKCLWTKISFETNSNCISSVWFESLHFAMINFTDAFPMQLWTTIILQLSWREGEGLSFPLPFESLSTTEDQTVCLSCFMLVEHPCNAQFIQHRSSYVGNQEWILTHHSHMYTYTYTSRLLWWWQSPSFQTYQGFHPLQFQLSLSQSFLVASHAMFSTRLAHTTVQSKRMKTMHEEKTQWMMETFHFSLDVKQNKLGMRFSPRCTPENSNMGKRSSHFSLVSHVLLS